MCIIANKTLVLRRREKVKKKEVALLLFIVLFPRLMYMKEEVEGLFVVRLSCSSNFVLMINVLFPFDIYLLFIILKFPPINNIIHLNKIITKGSFDADYEANFSFTKNRLFHKAYFTYTKNKEIFFFLVYIHIPIQTPCFLFYDISSFL
jgi:hypothetical protein